MAIVTELEPLNVSKDGVVDFDKLSNTTLHAVYKFIFAVAAENSVVAVIKTGVVSVQDEYLSELIKMFSTGRIEDENSQWFINNNDRNARKNAEQALVHSEGAHNWYEDDDVVKIELPLVDGQPKTTMIFSRQAWEQMVCLFIWLLVALLFMSQFASDDFNGERADITEISLDDGNEFELGENDCDETTEMYCADDEQTDGDDDDSDNDTYFNVSPNARDKALFDLYHKH